MSDASENALAREPSRKLAEAIRDVKNSAADRSDVVVELRDAERMRLELLVTELQPVFADVPADVDIFDFAVSSGLQPRLWIDAVSHVVMGRDKRTYRFVKDTRAGRVVLAETPEMQPVADQVTRYIAERLVERQRMLDGGPEVVAVADRADETAADASASEAAAAQDNRPGWARFLAGLYLVCSGALLAVFAAMLYLLWGRFGDLLTPM